MRYWPYFTNRSDHYFPILTQSPLFTALWLRCAAECDILGGPSVLLTVVGLGYCCLMDSPSGAVFGARQNDTLYAGPLAGPARAWREGGRRGGGGVVTAQFEGGKLTKR